MSAYPELLNGMMDAILTRSLVPARALHPDKKDFPAEKQLAIYVEGYRIRLYEVMENVYPALLYCIGKPAFKKLAEACIEATPSRNFNIDKYPLAFGSYVKANSDDAFAGELAILESAIHEVYQAEETQVLDNAWATQQTPDSLAASILLPRAASRLLAFDFPVNDYLAAFRAEQKPARPQPEETYLLLFRHKHQVQRLPLVKAEYALLQLLAEGKTLGAALEDERFAGYATDEQFAANLMEWLGRWVREGCLRQPV